MSYLYPSVDIKYTIYCHMKYYSKVPFSSYILFTRDYCYVPKSSSTKGGSTSGVVYYYDVFPLMARRFFCVAERMVRTARMGYRTCQVINFVTVLENEL